MRLKKTLSLMEFWLPQGRINFKLKNCGKLSIVRRIIKICHFAISCSAPLFSIIADIRTMTNFHFVAPSKCLTNIYFVLGYNLSRKFLHRKPIFAWESLFAAETDSVKLCRFLALQDNFLHYLPHQMNLWLLSECVLHYIKTLRRRSFSLSLI